jgi:hypothetical protein
MDPSTPSLAGDLTTRLVKGLAYKPSVPLAIWSSSWAKTAARFRCGSQSTGCEIDFKVRTGTVGTAMTFTVSERRMS